MRKNLKNNILIVLSAILSVTLLSACGSKSASYESYKTKSTADAGYVVSSANGAYGGEAYEESAYVEAPYYADDVAEADYEMAAPEEGGVLEEGAFQGRKFIKNVYMEIETLEYDSIMVNIKNKVESLGGYIEESSSSGNSSNGQVRYGNITARIPSQRLNEFTDHVLEAGNITDMSESVQDITLQYVDTDSRRKALETERDRLLKLMEKAENVSELIEIESRLGEVRYQLESAQSQLRMMDNQVDYSTVRISIREVKVYTPPEKRSIWREIADGFKGNVRGIARFFRSLFVEILAGSPIIILIVLIIILIRKFIGFLKKKNIIKGRKKSINGSGGIKTEVTLSEGATTGGAFSKDNLKAVNTENIKKKTVSLMNFVREKCAAFIKWIKGTASKLNTDKADKRDESDKPNGTDKTNSSNEVCNVIIRKAFVSDVPGIADIYNAIHGKEEAGECSTGWIRDIYPTEETAKVAVEKGDMYVIEADGRIVASAKFNKNQEECYKQAAWKYDTPADKVLVMHTLTVDPSCRKKGYARMFVRYYEKMAADVGCTDLRIDTNEKNAVARSMYKKFGFEEVGIVPCEFNGIPDVNLVCLEKRI